MNGLAQDLIDRLSFDLCRLQAKPGFVRSVHPYIAKLRVHVGHQGRQRVRYGPVLSIDLADPPFAVTSKRVLPGIFLPERGLNILSRLPSTLNPADRAAALRDHDCLSSK